MHRFWKQLHHIHCTRHLLIMRAAAGHCPNILIQGTHTMGWLTIEAFSTLVFRT